MLYNHANREVIEYFKTYRRFAPATEGEQRNVYTLQVRNIMLEQETMKVENYRRLKCEPWIVVFEGISCETKM